MTHVRDDVDNEIVLINGHAYINDISGPIPVLSVGVKGSPLRNIVGCGWKTAIMEIPVIYVAEKKAPAVKSYMVDGSFIASKFIVKIG